LSVINVSRFRVHMVACHVLCTFQMLSLGNGILFHGALAVGDF
jgi:hypothetical protein